MYNERTRQSMASARTTVAKTQRSYPQSDTIRVMRDIPVLDLQEIPETRRNCDGSIREGSNGTRSDCANGICGGFGLKDHPLAMVYSPCQAWRAAYTPDVALERGTLFSELDLPFERASYRKGGTL